MAQSAELVRVQNILDGMSRGLVNTPYDEVDFTPDSSQPTTITYKLLGSIVAVLTLTYNGSNNITAIVKTTS